MYAIDTSNHTVNDKKVDTFLRTVHDGDTHLEVEAGTTGFTGVCCRDAGSRTYLALLCPVAALTLPCSAGKATFSSARSRMTMAASSVSGSPAVATRV